MLKLFLSYYFFQINKKYLFVFLISLFVSEKFYSKNYFVNDDSLKNDIFTTAIGNDNNDGLSNKTPKLSLTEVYNLAQSGDTIYVDTGNYPEINNSGQLKFENIKKVKIIIAGFDNYVLSKTPLPSNEKVTPTDFFIIEDKPVNKDVYLQRLRSNPKKSKAE